MLDNLKNLTVAVGSRMVATVSRLVAAGGDDACDEEPSKRVAILVIDDFGCKKEEEGEGVEEGDEDDKNECEGKKPHCTEAADGQVFPPGGAVAAEDGGELAAIGAVFAAGGAASMIVDLADAKLANDENRPLCHGDLVWMKVVEVLEQADAEKCEENGLDCDKDWLPRESVWRVRGSDVHVIAVDTQGFDTCVIRKRIVDSLELLTSCGVERFVLNMSFAIIPCGEMTQEQYESALDNDPELAALAAVLQQRDGGQAPDEDRDASLKRLARTRTFYGPLENNEQTGPELIGAILEKLQNDPLRSFLEDPGPYIEMATDGKVMISTEDIISVAAVGNAERNFPFAPAIWKNVLSVTAAGARDEHHRYANNGEVRAYDVVEVEHKKEGTIPVHGTSFAAPEVSVRAALYLADGGDVTCEDNPTKFETTPPLAYAEENGCWKNMKLTDAKEKYCEGFPVTLP